MTRAAGATSRIGPALVALVVCVAAASAGPSSAGATGCPNEALRTGFSAALPDCRAYEKVSPESYGRGWDYSPGNFANPFFDGPTVAPDGDAATIDTEGIVGEEDGTGGTDHHVARRTSDGWVYTFESPSVTESASRYISGISPDQSVSVWTVNNGRGGTLEKPGFEEWFESLTPGAETAYISGPDGHYSLFGIGSLRTTIAPAAVRLNPDGSRIIFLTRHKKSKLEPDAPAEPSEGIYMRDLATGTTEVMSLLPGGATPVGNSVYKGSSAAANSVAFENYGTLYDRVGGTTHVLSSTSIACPSIVGFPGTTSIQWLRNGAPIAAATKATYALAPEDQFASVQCQITAVGVGVLVTEPENVEVGASQSAPTTPTPPVSSLQFAPTVVETPEAGEPPVPAEPRVGSTIECEHGAWTARGTLAFSYQWYSDGAPIAGATSASYEVTAGEVPSFIQCGVTATSEGESTAAFSFGRATDPAPPLSAPTPTISGSGTITCSSPANGWNLGTAVRWLRNGTPIEGATHATYILTAEDAGKSVQCRYEDLGPLAAAFGVSSPVANGSVVPRISGAAPTVLEEPEGGGIPVTAEPRVGSKLACEQGEWEAAGPLSYAYRWYHNNQPIAGATQQTYTVTANVVPSYLQCEVLATSGGATSTAASQIVSTIPRATPPTLSSFGGLEYERPEFGGGSADGRIVYYISGGAGELVELHTDTGQRTTVATAPRVWLTNVSADGSHAYFITETSLPGVAPNEYGQKPQAGLENLYAWNGSSVAFVGSVQSEILGALQEWPATLGRKALPHLNQSAANPDGSVLAFISVGEVVPGADAGEFGEVYRYDDATGSLVCASCNEDGSPPTGSAALNVPDHSVIGSLGLIPNVSASGGQVFFESPEALVGSDEDGVVDVYEWDEGEQRLISSGQSKFANHLYGASTDGSNVFFETSDSLLPEDRDEEFPTVYDARVDGGFAEPLPGEVCEEEGCQGALTAPPATAAPVTPGFVGVGNVKQSNTGVKHHHRRHKKRKKHHKKHRAGKKGPSGRKAGDK